MKLTFAAVTLASIVSLGASSPIKKRAGPPGGPSGSLVYPPGGATISNVGQTGHLAVKYIQVSNGKVDYYIGQTEGIDITLEPMNGNTRPAVKLTNGLASLGSENQLAHVAPIEASLYLADACGDYRLVVDESQFYQNELISFRSAAPAITITC